MGENVQCLKSLDELNAYTDGACRPFRAHYEITYRCNLRCGHCYVEQPAAKVGGAKPLDAATCVEAPFKEVLDALRRAGVLFVVVSGGEPLVREDWRDLILEIRRLRMSYRILTNGTLLTPQDALFLRSTGATAVDMSVYAPEGVYKPGTRALLHDYITGKKGSLKATLGAVDALRSAGLKVFIKTPLFELNYRHAAEMKRLAERLGCGFVADTTFIKPVLGFRKGYTALDEKEQEELFTQILPLSKEVLLEPAVGNLCGDVACSAGRGTLRVKPDGVVTPCVALPMAVCQAYGDEIAAAWRGNKELDTLRRLRLEDLPVCKACEHWRTCVRCPGEAFDEAGSIDGWSPSTCVKTRVLAKLRRRVLEGSP